jgi:hypothetical protein
VTSARLRPLEELLIELVLFSFGTASLENKCAAERRLGASAVGTRSFSKRSVGARLWSRLRITLVILGGVEHLLQESNTGVAYLVGFNTPSSLVGFNTP